MYVRDVCLGHDVQGRATHLNDDIIRADCVYVRVVCLYQGSQWRYVNVNWLGIWTKVY